MKPDPTLNQIRRQGLVKLTVTLSKASRKVDPSVVLKPPAANHTKEEERMETLIIEPKTTSTKERTVYAKGQRAEKKKKECDQIVCILRLIARCTIAVQI